jgi:hypothetical protein
VTSAGGQLAALLALRWQMVRSGGVRLGLVLTAAVVVWLLRVALTSGGALDSPSLATALELAPSAYLGFGFLAVIAPLTAGGGNELVPQDQLAAFPVRTSTYFLGGLLLAPLNLVWLVQLLALAAFTAFLTLDTSLPRGLVTTAAYVACITVGGQALAWLVVGLRQTCSSRRPRALPCRPAGAPPCWRPAPPTASCRASPQRTPTAGRSPPRCWSA